LSLVTARENVKQYDTFFFVVMLDTLKCYSEGWNPEDRSLVRVNIDMFILNISVFLP